MWILSYFSETNHLYTAKSTYRLGSSRIRKRFTKILRQIEYYIVYLCGYSVHTSIQFHVDFYRILRCISHIISFGQMINSSPVAGVSLFSFSDSLNDWLWFGGRLSFWGSSISLYFETMSTDIKYTTAKAKNWACLLSSCKKKDTHTDFSITISAACLFFCKVCPALP